MRVLWVVLLAGCGNAEPTVAPAPLITDAPVAAPAVDLAPMIPKHPAPFGPWATFPLGSRWDDVSKSLADAPRTTTLPRFGGVRVSGHVQAYTIDLDARGIAAVVAAWGPPTTITDGKGGRHSVWWGTQLRVEKTIEEGATRLVFTQALPISAFVGRKGLAFERGTSLVGMALKDALAAIEAWAAPLHYGVWSRSSADDTAAAIGRVTGNRATADRVMVVGKDGEVTPLSELAETTVTVYLPPNDHNYEAIEYRNTTLQLRLDKGIVRSYALRFWVADDASYHAATALFAKAYGKPKLSGDRLRFPSKPSACILATPRAYAGIDVGTCD